MNKLFRLIYVNLLSLFDINKIIIARKDQIKTTLETRTTILGLLSIAYGYLMYSLLIKFNIDNKMYFVSMGYIGSFLFCLFTDLFIVEAVLFSNKDNDLLFSLPVSKNQIVFSKLFNIYLRNIFFVVIIMLSTLFAYMKFETIDQTFVLMHILISLFIPFIPIVLCSLIAYANDYYKIKMNKVLYTIIKYSLILLVLIVVILLFRKLNNIELIMNRFHQVLPLSYLFYLTLRTENLFCFIMMMVVPILFIYLYNMFMSNNIMSLCSMLEGVNKNSHFEYKIGKVLNKFNGFVRKEVINLLKYKTYFFNSFSINFVFFFILVIVLNIIDIPKIKEMEYYSFYFNLYGPCLLGMLNTLSVSTVSSISLEKDNLMMIKSMPINMWKVLGAKWITNIIMVLPFLIIESILISIYFNLKLVTGIFWFIIPLFTLLFISLSGLVLDFRFVDRVSKSDNVIIRQRMIVIVPTFLSLIVGFVPMFFVVSLKYKLFLGSYILALTLLMLVEIIYMKTFKKKLEDGLTK